jgi:hypothetical protein
MGRHPFVGRHPERAVPVEAAIREGAFVFGRDAARQGWEPPPFSLRLADVPPLLAALFERALGREAAQGGSRPTAAEWLRALDETEAAATVCAEDGRHVKVHAACPWCRIEAEGGPAFFFHAAKAAEEHRREVLRRYHDLDLMTHYEVLDVDPSAADAQLREAFVRLAKAFNPDRQLEPGLVDLGPERQAVFTRVAKAYEVLRDRTRRGDYDRSLGRTADASAPAGLAPAGLALSTVPPAPPAATAPRPVPPPAAPAGLAPALSPRPALAVVPAAVSPADADASYRKPEDAIVRADKLLDIDRHWDAIQLVESVITKTLGTVRMRALVVLARAYLRNPQWAKRAEAILRDVVREDPGYVDAYVALAGLYERSGLRARSQAMTRKALEIQLRSRPPAG